MRRRGEEGPAFRTRTLTLPAASVARRSPNAPSSQRVPQACSMACPQDASRSRPARLALSHSRYRRHAQPTPTSLTPVPSRGPQCPPHDPTPTRPCPVGRAWSRSASAAIRTSWPVGAPPQWGLHTRFAPQRVAGPSDVPRPASALFHGHWSRNRSSGRRSYLLSSVARSAVVRHPFTGPEWPIPRYFGALVWRAVMDRLGAGRSPFSTVESPAEDGRCKWGKLYAGSRSRA